jgi:hypothetical protein
MGLLGEEARIGEVGEGVLQFPFLRVLGAATLTYLSQT